MSEFLALNFDMQSSPLINIKSIDTKNQSSGWGFGWYPNDDYSAFVIKDTTLNDDKLSNNISDLNNFRSTTFICKTKCAAKNYTLHDLQPFSWRFAGKDWLFMHNGDVKKSELKKVHTTGLDFLTPLGNTDSELLFCYLLGKIRLSGAKEISELHGKTILKWLTEIESFGTMDLVLSDRKTLLVYHGVNSNKEIYLTKIAPPQNIGRFESDSITMQMDNPKDEYNSCLIACSEPLTNTKQELMTAGQLVIARRGAIMWQGEYNSVAQDRRTPVSTQESALATN